MVLGQVWRKWWRSHIDDTLTFSPSEVRTWNRYYILIAVQEAIGFRQSPKQAPVCARTTLHAGLTCTNVRIRDPESVKLARLNLTTAGNSARHVELSDSAQQHWVYHQVSSQPLVI